MRACIVGIQNIKHMTLISMYTEYFRRNNIEYDIIYIDKYGINESTDADQIYKFDGSDKKYAGIAGKLYKSILFRKYAKDILKNNKYDFVVVWREQTAFMLSSFLKKYYRGRYSVNIRDLWNPKNVFLTQGVRKAVSFSAFNTVSSEGFIRYLPNAEYTMVHSANKKIISEGFRTGDRNKLPIKITYIGTLRFQEYCMNLIKAFNNDNRFILEFIGQGSEEIEEFVKKNGYTNVICSGSFDPKETNDKLKGTHIINCAFGSKELAERMLTPIRMYYAVGAGIPILTADGTWLDELGKKYGMGITVPSSLDPKTIISNKVMEQYQDLDFEKMEFLQSQLKDEIEESCNSFNVLLDSALALDRKDSK